MRPPSASLLASRPARLSYQLRRESGSHLEERRGIVSLALTAAGCMSLIALYQMGVLRRLPDIPLRPFDSAGIEAAPEAYRCLRMGDAFLSLTSYAATAALAATGGKNRAYDQPWVPLALAAKTAADALIAGHSILQQWRKHRALCIWCLGAGLAALAAVPLASREAGSAARHLAHRR